MVSMASHERNSAVTGLQEHDAIVKEADLIATHGILNPLDTDPSRIEPFIQAIGEQNYKQAIESGLNTWYSSEGLRHTIPYRAYEQFRSHLLSCELALRAVVLCSEGNDEIVDNFDDQMISLERRSTQKIDITPVKNNFLSLGKAKELIDEDREDGDELLLEDVVTFARLTLDLNMMYSLFVENNEGVISGTIANPNNARKLARKYERLQKTDNQFMMAELGIIMGKYRLDVADSQTDNDIATQQVRINGMIHRRTAGDILPLPTKRKRLYKYLPSNRAVYEKYGVVETEEEAPHLSEEQRERILAGIALEREKQEIKNREKEIRAAKEAREHDAPILDYLQQLAQDYNIKIAQFTEQTTRSLREKGIFGKDSLHFKLLCERKAVDAAATDRILRVYAGLYDVAKSDGDAREELEEMLLELEIIEAEYTSFLAAHPLKGYEKPLQLRNSIKPEIAWLTANFPAVESAIMNSQHMKHYGDLQRRHLRTMLGIDPDENGQSETQTRAVDQESESPLIKANRLAEKLQWVVLPEDHITPDDLVDAVTDIIEKRKSGKNDQGPATVERYRMEGLLKLRSEYGGTLYRSKKRMLGDSDNLYFVLRFQHPGDDRYYAVAENPVYGNATYVLCEDTLPLMPGETVLTAVREGRNTVRGLGAKRIIHGTPAVDIHLDKIDTHIAKLSEDEALR